MRGFDMLSRIAFGILFLALVGCKGGDAIYPVTGTATFNGTPILTGEIFFEPDASAGNKGPQGYARIKDGKFDTADGGRGIKGGPCVIRVSGYDGMTSDELPLGKALFREYQEKRELPKAPSEQSFEVPLPLPSLPPEEPSEK